MTQRECGSNEVESHDIKKCFHASQATINKAVNNDGKPRRNQAGMHEVTAMLHHLWKPQEECRSTSCRSVFRDSGWHRMLRRC